MRILCLLRGKNVLSETSVSLLLTLKSLTQHTTGIFSSMKVRLTFHVNAHKT